MNSGTRREAILIFVLLAFIYAYFYHDSTWNGNSRLGLTFAIVQEGRLTIDSFHDQPGTATGDKSFYEGHYYSDKAIGTSLLAVLFYFPLYLLEQLFNFKLPIVEVKYLLTFFTIGLPSSLAGSLMYVLAKRVAGNRYQAFVATLAIACGTLIFPFSVIFISHQLAGALLFIAFFLIFQLKNGSLGSSDTSQNSQKALKHSPDNLRKLNQFLIGLLLGYSLITEYTVAPIVLILGIYYFYATFKNSRADWISAVILPALGAIIPIAGFLAYNAAIFGNPLSIGYSHMARPDFQQAHAQGLMGVGWPKLQIMFYLTFHPAMGLFWQSPVLILALVGIWYMLHKPEYRVEALVAFLAFFSLFMINSGYYMWWGGWSFGPRHLTPMLSFLCLPLVFIPVRWFSGVAILGLISMVQMFIAVSSRILIPDSFFFEIGQHAYFDYSSIYSYCLPLLLDGHFARNLGNKILGLHGWLSLLPLLTGMMVISLIFFWRRERPSRCSAESN